MVSFRKIQDKMKDKYNRLVCTSVKGEDPIRKNHTAYFAPSPFCRPSWFAFTTTAKFNKCHKAHGFSERSQRPFNNFGLCHILIISQTQINSDL